MASGWKSIRSPASPSFPERRFANRELFARELRTPQLRCAELLFLTWLLCSPFSSSLSEFQFSLRFLVAGILHMRPQICTSVSSDFD